MNASQLSANALQEAPTNSCNVYREKPIEHTTPILSSSQLLLKPDHRPGRKQRDHFLDPSPEKCYGDIIIQKKPKTTRLFFQNCKGLTYSSSGDDYRYYMSCLSAYSIDVVGLSETNTCWSHPHIRYDFQKGIRNFYKQSKVNFGSPSKEIDEILPSETFQAGGNLTMITGCLVSSAKQMSMPADPTGLGRWSSVSLLGKAQTCLTIITAYRTCKGSHRTAPLGSTFLREYEYCRAKNLSNPRKTFLEDLYKFISKLQEDGHLIILMIDANSTLEADHDFSSFIELCDLTDLHRQDPAPSTFVGSPNRRIDFIFGCSKTVSYVTRSGTLAYSEGPQSDHRGLYVDLQMDNLFNHSATKTYQMAERALHTGNPELVEAYHRKMLRYYENHKMQQRIDDLYNNINQLSKNEITQRLITWDTDQGRAMTNAEASLRITPKKFRWSPKLRNIAIIRRYWKLRQREQKFDENYSLTFQKWEEKIRVHDNSFRLPLLHKVLTKDEISKQLSRATTEFRKAQRSSISLRQQCYFDLLSTYEEDSNPLSIRESKRKAKIVKNTIAGETCRHIFKNIRNVVKPTEAGSIEKIMIPIIASNDKDCNHQSVYQQLQGQAQDDFLWETIIEREQMEQYLLSYNRESFRAASESPCGSGSLHEAISFSGLSNVAKEILNGNIPIALCDDDEILKEFLSSFEKPACVKDLKSGINTFLSEEDVKNGFLKWRESTTTSPSGRHLGHYRAIVQQPILLSCLTKFLNIIVKTAIVLPRWTNATNVMLEKDAGQPRINRLRIIHLFEADLNFFLKIQWGHRLVRHAHSLDILHPGQHGSIPNRMATDPVMLLQLTTDLCRILKHDLARFDNDASACYDRIIVALGMLAAQRCGMPKNAIKLHSEALRLMKYAVKTAHGISEENYHGTPLEPLFGTGQGSGASPSVWLTLIVIMLNTLDRLVKERIQFQSLDGKLQHQRLVDAFVDDTSIGFTSSSDDTEYHELVERLQKAAQTWEHILFLSGGKLNLQKSSWYTMRWEWHNGRPRIRESQPEDPTIDLQEGNTEVKKTIRQTSPTDSSKMLGVFINPLGNFNEQIIAMKRKADTFAARLYSPKLTAEDIRIFHRSIYVPSMRYGLATLAVDEECLETIQTKVIRAILQKMHVSSSISTSIRFGPLEFGGLGLYDLRTEMGIESIKFLCESLHSQNENGKLIRLNLQYSQLESGSDIPLLEFPSRHVPYLTPSWLLSLRQFMSNHNLSLTTPDDYVPKLQGSSDEFVMQMKHLSRYSNSQQQDINLVRIYLQVSTLAEMSDLNRTDSVSLSFLDGKRPLGWISNKNWPRQHEPTPRQRKLWKNYIKSSFLRYIPLWKSPPGHGKEKVTQGDGTGQDLVDRSLDLPELIRKLPRTKRRLLSNIQQIASDDTIWTSLRSKRKLYIASDGGLKEKLGTMGWVLSTKKTDLFHASGPVDGPSDTVSSTRCELAGLASFLVFCEILSTKWGVRFRCKFRWITDSQAALKRVQRYVLCTASKPRKLPNDADLLAIISQSLSIIKRPILPVWVKGHQDDREKYDTLPLKVRLNTKADALATAYRREGHLRSSEKVDHQKDQQVSISMNGQRLTGQYHECLRFHINGYHLKQEMMKRHTWDNKSWEDIDFNSFGQHMKKLQAHAQVNGTKLAHEQLHTGLRRFQVSKTKDSTLKLCPCCKMSDESQQHLLRCKDNSTQNHSFQMLRKNIINRDTHPFRYLVIQGIEHWIHHGDQDRFDPDISQYPPHFQSRIQEVIVSQERIGWYQLMLGFMSKSWTTLAALDLYDPSVEDFDKGRQRIRDTIRRVHEYTIEIWKARNETLHSGNDEDLEQVRSEESTRIKLLHTMREKLLPWDRHYCDRKLEQILKAAPSTRRRWLRKVENSMALQDQYNTGQTSITQFFTRQ